MIKTFDIWTFEPLIGVLSWVGFFEFNAYRLVKTTTALEEIKKSKWTILQYFYVVQLSRAEFANLESP